MTEPKHIRLSERKELASRLIVAEETFHPERNRAKLEPKELHAVRDELPLVRKYIASRTRVKDERAVANKETLGSFVRGRSERLESTAIFPSETTEKLIGDDVGRARQRFQQKHCHVCTDGGAVCDGSADDHEIVHRGACLEPVREAFRLARDITTAYYETYAPTFRAQNPRPELDWGTEKIPQPPEHLGGLNINGTTTYPDPDDRRVARVTLDCTQAEFNDRDYLALVALFMHECMAHAFQGAGPGKGARPRAKANDAWSEGWMDWIALRALEDVGAGKGPAAGLRARLAESRSTLPGADALLRRKRLEAADEFQTSRTDRASSEKYMPDRRAGFEAAVDFKNFLMDECGRSEDEAFEALYEISMEINLRRMSVDDRNDLTLRLGDGPRVWRDKLAGLLCPLKAGQFDADSFITQVMRWT